MSSKKSYKSVQPLVTLLLREDMFGPMMNLRYKKDRVDYARYLFTRCIFGNDGEEYIYGNTTIFSFPKGYKNYVRKDENIFATISMEVFTYKTSLIQSVMEFFHVGLNNLMERVRAGQVVCNDTNTLKGIQWLNPDVIDWCNIPEYIPISDFFAMAMSCNGKNTTHQAHYMNWVFYVLGASLIDYLDRKKLYHDLYKKCNKNMNKLKKDRLFLHQDKYLKYYLNAGEEIIARKFRKTYVDYVFKG